MPEETALDVLNKLVNAANRLRRTAIVDDDFPAIAHTFDSQLAAARAFIAEHNKPKEQRKGKPSGATRPT